MIINIHPLWGLLSTQRGPKGTILLRNTLTGRKHTKGPRASKVCPKHYNIPWLDMKYWYMMHIETRVWRTGTGNSRYREFSIFLVVSEPVSEQIGTGKKSRNRYRSNLVPIKSLGTGIGEIWYRKKVSEPVSEKFDTGTEFRCQNLGILKIYNGYRYRIGTGTENFSFLWWYRNRYRKNLVPEKSLGTGIGQIWYRKKVSEPVSGKFGTGKKYRYRYRKYLVPEKSIGIGIVQHFGYRHTLVRIRKADRRLQSDKRLNLEVTQQPLTPLWRKTTKNCWKHLL